MLRVRRQVLEDGSSRHRATGSSIAAASCNSRPAPQWPMTSSCRFRFPEWPTATSRQPVFSDARMRRGVLSQLPVSLPDAVTSRTVWNKPRTSVAAPLHPSAQSSVVTTDYGWIDSGDADRDEESNKENHVVEAEVVEDLDRDQWRSQRCRESFEVDVVSPWRSPNSSISMDVDDDDNSVDMMPPYDSLGTTPSGGRRTHPPCGTGGPSMMSRVWRHRLPLGTIREATEPSVKSTINSSESSSSSINGEKPADEPAEESDAVRPEPEMATADNFYELVSRSTLSTSPVDNDDDYVRSHLEGMDQEEAVQSDNITDVSVRQRCAGWRFSSSRTRLTVAEFCRRRRDPETKKRQRSASIADDSLSVNDSVASLGPSTKRRRTSLKVHTS